jgi:hypothetical protein
MKGRNTLHRAFREYGITKDAEYTLPSEDMKNRFAGLVNEEISTFIHHELGEASQRKEFGTWWKDLLVMLPHSRAEFFVRSLKDVIADTCASGTLTHIIQNKKAGSLGFYVALLNGYRKTVFPGMTPAYEEFAETGNWDLIEKARIEGYGRVREYTGKLKRMYKKGNLTKEMIEEAFLLDTV